jgi:hypothetical protein
MLAALVGIGRVARPEPMVRALVFAQDGPGPVGYELHSTCHWPIVQGDESKVKSPWQAPTIPGRPAAIAESAHVRRQSSSRKVRRETDLARESVPPPILGELALFQCQPETGTAVGNAGLSRFALANFSGIRPGTAPSSSASWASFTDIPQEAARHGSGTPMLELMAPPPTDRRSGSACAGSEPAQPVRRDAGTRRNSRWACDSSLQQALHAVYVSKVV